MNEQYRELLFIDLCGRIPYKVRMFEIEPVNNIQSNLTLLSITNKESVICITPSGGVIGSSIDAFKPYLYPLSSMTGRLKAELFNLRIDIEDPFQDTLCEIDFYHRNHFDYRGLIEKGLAIDATGLNIY